MPPESLSTGFEKPDGAKKARFSRCLYSLIFVGVLVVLIILWNCNRSRNKRLLGDLRSSQALVSIDAINHEAWSQLLQRYVDKEGRVDYQGWSSDHGAVASLESYLFQLGSANPILESTGSNRLAFWINAYNALTVYGILQEYPTSSIRNHTSSFGGYNIWHDLQLRIGKRTYSLHQIEHEVLRKANEPRIHFAIVCASQSCPRLLNEAYRGTSLEKQLTANAKQFFSQPGNFSLSDHGRTVYLSSILSWFAEDFGGGKKEVFDAIRPYLPKETRSRVSPSTRVEYLDYDWSLNEKR